MGNVCDEEGPGYIYSHSAYIEDICFFEVITKYENLFMFSTHEMIYIIGINHGFQCSNIRWITRKAFEHKAAGRVFKPLPSDPANV